MLIDLEDDNVEASDMKERLITLEDISMFLSGSKYLPNKISLTFDHDDTQKGISVSTCFNEITIPVAERYVGLNFSENFLHFTFFSITSWTKTPYHIKSANVN